MFEVFCKLWHKLNVNKKFEQSSQDVQKRIAVPVRR